MTTTPSPSIATTTFDVHLTAKQSDHRLAPAGVISLSTEPTDALIDLSIDPTQRFQTHLGIGGALTESSAINYQQLDDAGREQLLNDYFSSTVGHGYTFWRTHIHACDFSRGGYTYVEDGDASLKSFSLDADRPALLPFIKDALQVADRPVSLLASPWSPPAWMKDAPSMKQGGRLLPEHRQTWANYYVRYIQAMQDEGIDIWGVTVQNEPEAVQTWESCLYSAEEERDFVRDHLGPTLENAGLGDVKIIVWDHNRDLLFDRASTVYDDPEASKYVWGAGFHWYCGDFFENVQRTHDAYPDKHLIFTEGCQEGGPHIGSWATGERYGRSLINDFNRWTTGWLDWNLLLDETGGPNHVNNLCSAPILLDRPSGRLMHQSSYAYLGHFARFIQPGATRIGCRVSHADILATAYENPDGTLAIVIMNAGDFDFPVRLSHTSHQATLNAPAHSIQTLISQTA
ncbi:glycoside hydrolase family 30 protein [Mucisphaera sp.]|uniref:glycoside hydrolase family 30 protein n=1 Tax=Mucisphaera sp. TaxID=2913024 RepID=UPI003D0B9877